MPTRRALVIGAGIAGLATTCRLLRSDWDVVLLSVPAPPRTHGLPEVFSGIGLDAARRLGLLPALTERRQPRCDLVQVDAAGVPLAVRPKPPLHRPALCREDFLSVLGDVVGDAASRRDAEAPVLTADDCGVTATFANGDEDWFDLVVGSDGPNSLVRKTIAAAPHAALPGWSAVTARIEPRTSCAVAMDLPGRSVRLHPLRDKGSAVSFAWTHSPGAGWPEVFSDLGWIVPELVSHVDTDPGTQRIAVAGVHTDRWARGRIALIGDAAWRTDAHADRGASLSIGGAELLGDALDIFTDTAEALRWWERTLRPFVRRAQAGHGGAGNNWNHAEDGRQVLPVR